MTSADLVQHVLPVSLEQHVFPASSEQHVLLASSKQNDHGAVEADVVNLVSSDESSS